jgi:hypothetical protein
MNTRIGIEMKCVAYLNIDYVPLHDIVREFTGFNKARPSSSDFSRSLDFLEYLLMKYRLKYYASPGEKQIDIPNDELIGWLRQQWNEGKYEAISYGLWFEKSC